jgi:hypothetical protein
MVWTRHGDFGYVTARSRIPREDRRDVTLEFRFLTRTLPLDDLNAPHFDSFHRQTAFDDVV